MLTAFRTGGNTFWHLFQPIQDPGLKLSVGEQTRIAYLYLLEIVGLSVREARIGQVYYWWQRVDLNQ